MKKILFVFTLLPQLAFAQANQIRVLPTRYDSQAHSYKLSPSGVSTVSQVVGRYFDPQKFRGINAQLLRDVNGTPDHILVYLFRPGYHQVRNAAIWVDENIKPTHVEMDYHLRKSDVVQQPGIDALHATCPDTTIQFLAFAPNDDQLEQEITQTVGNDAQSHGLKTKMLLKNEATRENYLNYMSCPNVIGNFYDGDANPSEITTFDGAISASEIANILQGAFRTKVTNIWLACQAFNDPMETAMIKNAQSQKYYAGINNLLVGPSDKAAACTMSAVIDGKSISESFTACYKKYDSPEDRWGFGGDGADYLGR